MRTNTACNTFMRAPGFLQGVFFADQVMEHVAQVFFLSWVGVKLPFIIDLNKQ